MKIFRQDLKTFQQVLALINRKYVEPVKTHDLMVESIHGLVKALDDPYSGYLLPKDKARLDKHLGEGEALFVGIGIEVGVSDGKVEVIAPIPDTPAFEANIQSGDKILAVDGTKIYDLKQATSLIKGEQNTKVILTIDRDEIPEPFNISVVRKPIGNPPIVKVELPNNVGYIRLPSFHYSSSSEVFKALEYLDFAGMENLIFDLRRNPGGLLDASVVIANNFLPADSTIVSVRKRKGIPEKFYKANGDAKFLTLPVVLLVDGYSASASEILTGALKDNNRATVMGKRTYGKGSVQEIIPLEDGSALRVTIAKYYTPSGESIHQIGIDPHIELTAKLIEEATGEDFGKVPALFDPEIYLAYQHIVSGTP